MEVKKMRKSGKLHFKEMVMHSAACVPCSVGGWMKDGSKWHYAMDTTILVSQDKQTKRDN